MAELVMAYVLTTHLPPPLSNILKGQVKVSALALRFLMGVIPRGFESHSLQINKFFAAGCFFCCTD